MPLRRSISSTGRYPRSRWAPAVDGIVHTSIGRTDGRVGERADDRRAQGRPEHRGRVGAPAVLERPDHGGDGPDVLQRRPDRRRVEPVESGTGDSRRVRREYAATGVADGPVGEPAARARDGCEQRERIEHGPVEAGSKPPSRSVGSS